VQLPFGVPARSVNVLRSAMLNVLVVEDERELGSLFRDYITTLGHRADVVSSAEAALERLQVAPPHVMILDVKLPGMSGLELLGLPIVRDCASRSSSSPAT
jgi:CheY-like chemotaxis protein